MDLRLIAICLQSYNSCTLFTFQVFGNWPAFLTDCWILHFTIFLPFSSKPTDWISWIQTYDHVTHLTAIIKRVIKLNPVRWWLNLWLQWLKIPGLVVIVKSRTTCMPITVPILTMQCSCRWSKASEAPNVFSKQWSKSWDSVTEASFFSYLCAISQYKGGGACITMAEHSFHHLFSSSSISHFCRLSIYYVYAIHTIKSKQPIQSSEGRHKTIEYNHLNFAYCSLI